MIIVTGVPFLLPASKRIGIAQLVGKKRTPVSKNKIFKRNFYSFYTIQTSHNANKHYLNYKS